MYLNVSLALIYPPFVIGECMHIYVFQKFKILYDCSMLSVTQVLLTVSKPATHEEFNIS